MATSAVRVRLDNSAIGRATMPGGIVYRPTDRVGEAIAVLARVKSPKRTGRMVRSINSSPRSANQYGCSFRISVDVPYATFVLGGTVGPIYADFRRSSTGQFAPGGRKRLAVGRSQGGPVIYRRSVSGQTANDFLTEAVHEVLARYNL